MSSLLRTAQAAALIALCACAPGSEPAEPGQLVAVLDGREIHDADLDAWIRQDLYDSAIAGKDAVGVYEFRSEALARMVDEQLIAAAAEQRGIDVDELQREAIAAAAVTDQEVAQFYEQNRDRVGTATLEDLSERMREFLLDQKQGEAWAAFVSSLREKATLTMKLEPLRTEVAATGPGLGPDDAKVVIVEFSDFSCPYCQRVTPTLRALRERYPEQVRIVFRHYPLDNIHPQARALAEASVCADEQGQFWAFHDRAFADGPAVAARSMAGELGLDLAAFDACLADGHAAAVVQGDWEAGSAAGVTGTPAFFVNGIRLSGAHPLDAFVRLVDEELARSGGGSPTS